jgi:putative nucleotidyltransferase with HDIG domain
LSGSTIMARRRKQHIISIAGFIFTAIVIILLFPKQGKFKYEYQQGRPWQHEDLVTPFDFPIMKSKKEVSDEIGQVKRNTKQFFKNDSSRIKFSKNVLLTNIERELRNLYKSDKLNKIIIAIEFNETLEKAYIDDIREKGNECMDSLYKQGIIEENEKIRSKSKDYIVYLSEDENAYHEEFMGNFLTLPMAVDAIDAYCKDMDPTEGQILESALIQSIRPNILYDAGTTIKFQDNEIKNIATTKGAVPSGQVIISNGEIVNDEKISLLDSYKAYYNKERGGLVNSFSLILGQSIFVGMLLFFLYMFMFLFRKDLLRSYKKTFSILSLEIVALVMVFIISHFNSLSIYILPYTILPILIRSFYDTRQALFAHIIAILLSAYFAPNNYEFIILQMGAGMISIFSFVGFRKRAQLFLTIFIIFVTYSALYTAIALMKNGKISEDETYMYLYFFISCFLTLLTFAFIFIFEKIFGFHSDFTLLEITDTNSKLLKELSVRAPGTFQHSIQVANIAEAAISEIGGDTLLMRAGALYHDIGKMKEPLYFIENQVYGSNPHEKLSEEESAQKIMDHVSHGVELIKKEKLPPVIMDFIKTHHGTTQVQYFYKNFIKSHPDAEVDMSKFTYPGPTPSSKEQAVLMMVDSVEAASRSIQDPDYKKLSELVDKIIDRQIKEKQYDNADITIKEINKVKQILKEKLVAIYHVRIEYPE